MKSKKVLSGFLMFFTLINIIPQLYGYSYGNDECCNCNAKSYITSEAKSFDANASNNEDLQYPVEMEVFENYDGKIYVNLNNISAFTKSDFNIYLAFYDISGRLIHIKSCTIDKLYRHSEKTVNFEVPDNQIKTAYTIKTFAWSKETIPYSKAVYFKKDGVSADLNSVALWLQADNKTMLSYGVKYELDAAPVMVNEILMASARPLAEGFACSVYWNEAESTIMIEYKGNIISAEKGNRTALYNGEKFELSEPVCVINGMVYIPVEDIAALLGYNSEFNSQTNELFILVGEIEHLVKCAGSRSYMPRYLFDKNIHEKMTRFDAAQLLAAIYETITAEELSPADNSTFTDTEDISVLKLVKAGILQGVSDNEFAPDEAVTNGEFAAALYNTLTAVGVYIPPDVENVKLYHNHNEISSAVRDTVYMLKAYGALDSVYNRIFPNTDCITVGQAIAATENSLLISYDSVFPDVNPENPHRKAIIRLSRLGICNGYEDGTFHPEEYVLRSEFSVFLARMTRAENLDGYSFSCSDVSAGNWAAKYIGYCISNGYMILENDKFRPDDCITQTEAISSLLRVLGYNELVSDEYIIGKASEIGLLCNINSDRTKGKSIREEIAQLIYNALKIKNDI